jgi:hypothetical protein
MQGIPLDEQVGRIFRDPYPQENRNTPEANRIMKSAGPLSIVKSQYAFGLTQIRF